MKISEQWLREWTDPPLNRRELASLLTMSGLEVESCNSVAGSFTMVVVALVTAVTQHPAADKLVICNLECGEIEPLQVVCGANNVRTGLKVALAKIGACLPGDIVIKVTALRGAPSYG